MATVSRTYSKPEALENESAQTSNRELKGVMLQPKWRQLLPSWLIFIAAVIVITATVCLAFLSSSSQPILIFDSPETTILFLNVGSVLSVFLLSELLEGTCEYLRWVFAARPSGVGIAAFLALGRATGGLGIIQLLFSKQSCNHRRWCIQRYLR
jgi:hypothetical protein